MSQVYLPVRQQSASSAIPLPSTDKQLNVGEVQESYLDHKNKLVHALDESQDILSELRVFNKSSWVVRYPHFREQTPSTSGDSPGRSSPRRSMCFADDPTFETDVSLSPDSTNGLSCSLSVSSHSSDKTAVNGEIPNKEEGLILPSSADFDFHVLRLDLKLGPHGSSSSAGSLVSQLEKSSIANLLEERISAALNHMKKLRLRVEDTSSKVLVTGDLNAGKSTLVNALLRREVMPIDQQPCTSAFCEIHDASENEGKEEVHIVREGFTYAVSDESTYNRVPIEELDEYMSENPNALSFVKVYIKNSRPPTESFLNNGIADISLIDAPGLNRDSFKTTALFARQEEIDVVVFVVSAENHFTLSGREFLQSASSEKAYLFIVVNKFEQIKDKAKLKRLLFKQIQELSPRTFEDAADLVHFVDASSINGERSTASFDSLESSLRSFVLLKRSKSKLNPAANYLTNLLADVDLLTGANAILAQAELDRARGDLENSRPALEKLKGDREVLDENLENIEEGGASTASNETKRILLQALDKVGAGELATSEAGFSLPSYPGFLNLWDYARDVRRAFLASLDLAVKLSENEARITTTKNVNAISKLANKFLPEGVQKSRRVFIPEAMFSRRRITRKGRELRNSMVVAGGLYGLGIGLVQRPELLETTFNDIVDVPHQFNVYFGDKFEKAIDDGEDIMPSALSFVSVGVGAVTLLGGKTLGIRGIVEGVLRLTDLWGSETARKWAAPVLGIVVVGLGAYVVLELPNTIPRTVGRRVRTQLEREAARGGPSGGFVNSNADRISRETRKVLRIASWELRERFRGALDERTKEVHVAEELVKQTENALIWFANTQKRTAGVRSELQTVVEDL